MVSSHVTNFYFQNTKSKVVCRAFHVKFSYISPWKGRQSELHLQLSCILNEFYVEGSEPPNLSTCEENPFSNIDMNMQSPLERRQIDPNQSVQHPRNGELKTPQHQATLWSSK